MKLLSLLVGVVTAALVTACGGGGGSPGANPNQPDLVTTAGASVVIAPGAVGVYGISGGVPPYRVQNADVAVAQGAVSGSNLTINGIKPGQTTVSVLDYAGSSTEIDVRVGSSIPLTLTAPSTLSLALGPTAAQTFEVRGGVAPYVVASSDPRVIGVYLDSNTAKITVTGLAVGNATVTVRDQANNSVSFSVSTAAAQALSTSAPVTLTLAVNSTQTYKILGGVKPYQVSSGNPAVLAATKQFEDDLVLRGVSGGQASVVITDFAGAILTRTVTVGSSNPLFSTAPDTLTLAPSERTTNFTISGGATPYSVTSSNGSIAQVTFSGSTFSITAGTLGGSANVFVTDSTGARLKVGVTVDAPTGGETPVQPAATIEVLTSSNTMQSAGTGVTITAYVKDSLNVAMADTPVSMSADSGLLQNASTRTDAKGLATAQLLVGADKSNRTIRVTVRSGTASGFVTVSVVGTRVVLNGDAAVKRLGSAPYTVRVLDSAGNGVAGASVTLTSSLSNPLNPNPVTTDALGSATSTYTATNTGTDTLTASSLGATGTVSVLVSAIDFGFVSPASGAQIALNTNQQLTVQYLNNGVGVAGQTVTFTTTRGTLSGGNVTATSSVTNASGQASINIASSTAGPATVLAQIQGVGQASIPVNFVAGTPASVAVQSNPGAIPPNSGGSTLSRSTIVATVRDANNNPVAGKQVNFNITSDVSGGTLSSPSATTDSTGRAQVDYIAGATSTAVNGVTISVTVNGTAITNSTSLTVNSQSLFLTIGLGNDITNVDSTTYSKPFSVYLTDATGNAVGSQPVTVSVIPTSYQKGSLVWDDVIKLWVFAPGSPTISCPNTDTNFNGIVDAGAPFNEVGPLRPGNVVVATPSVATTDAAGRALFSLQYGEQYAPWVTVNIVARTTVSGTESVRTSAYDLGGSGEDFNKKEVAPAGAVSPFGTNASCP